MDSRLEKLTKQQVSDLQNQLAECRAHTDDAQSREADAALRAELEAAQATQAEAQERNESLVQELEAANQKAEALQQAAEGGVLQFLAELALLLP